MGTSEDDTICVSEDRLHVESRHGWKNEFMLGGRHCAIVHNGMKIRTEVTFSIACKKESCSSAKQKSMTRSSTEVELNDIDDKISRTAWTKIFFQHQSIKLKLSILYQDNTSTIKLAENSKATSKKN